MFRNDMRSTRPTCGTIAPAIVRGAAAGGRPDRAWPSPASAHVTITPSTTAAGAFAVLEVSVGHGCEGSPTTEITIQMPAGDQLP